MRQIHYNEIKSLNETLIKRLRYVIHKREFSFTSDLLLAVEFKTTVPIIPETRCFKRPLRL